MRTTDAYSTQSDVRERTIDPKLPRPKLADRPGAVFSELQTIF